jgi:murein DD-endopeptidase MepM/ murein hydrolase activator NlpD
VRASRLPLFLVGGSALGLLFVGDRPLSYASTSNGRVTSPLGTWVWPVPSYRGRRPVISDGWGSARDGGVRQHRGVDIMFKRAHREEFVADFPPGTPDGSKGYFVPPGTVTVAASDGRIWSAGWTPRGYAVVIDHGKPWATYYAHLASLQVAAGDGVRAGQPLGVIGADPLDSQKLRHLHFALWNGGAGESAIDPEPVMHGWCAVEMRDV